jgi:hypothetical protein
MGKIERKIAITGDKESIDVTALFDTGSSKTFARKDVAERACTIQSHPKAIDITLADGKTKIKEIGICALKMRVEGRDMIDVVHVIDVDKSAELYIGWPTLQRFNIALQFGRTPKDDRIDCSNFTEEMNELS